MKKSLTKLLARMAKDGDVEAVAEFIEEMIEGEPETKAEAAAEAVEEVTEAVAGAVAEAVSGANNGSTGAIAPEGTEVTVDEDTVAGIIERLDRLIELLTPVPAAEEDPEERPAEEVAEVIEEVIEAVEEAESAEVIPEDNAAEEVAEIVEAILEPDVSTTLEEVVEGDEDPDDPEGTCGNDALRTALAAAAPRLAKMSRKQRRKAAADIAARVKKARGMGSNRGYDRAASAKFQKGSAAYAALGKRIMASRNANYHK